MICFLFFLNFEQVKLSKVIKYFVFNFIITFLIFLNQKRTSILKLFIKDRNKKYLSENICKKNIKFTKYSCVNF